MASKQVSSPMGRKAELDRVIRIFIVDDHPIFREGLKRVLADDDSFVIAGEASSSSEAFGMLQEQDDIDVLVLDLRMPGRSGLSLLEEVRNVHPDLPVLVVSVEPEDVYAVRTIAAGASGFLQKDHVDGDNLKEALSRLADGGRYITPRIGARLAEFVNAPQAKRPPLERLSDRELEVLQLMGGGSTVSEIAEQLSLSAKTVSTYRSRILEKLGMKNTAQLIRYAIENDLV